ncbi:MAG: PAS domain S-box protein [Candidatus Thiodiazotropha endolucinida]|nr:PAS domain S-box protein [Candidatus Thiodiazotropha endolucinida]
MLNKDMARFAAEHTALEIYWADTAARFIEVNDAACQALGYSRQELLVLSVPQINPLFPPPQWQKLLETLHTGEPQRFESVHRRKNGSDYPVEVTLSLLHTGDQELVCAFAADISERRESTQQLEQKHEKLMFLLDNINGISWELDLLEQCFTYVSPNAERILGYPADSWIDTESWLEMVVPEDREFAGHHRAAETTAGRDYTFEYRIRKKNGEVVWVMDIVTVIKDQEGNPVKLTGFILDNSRQRLLMRELQASEEAARQTLERFDLAMRGNNVGVFDWDLNTDEVYYSPRWKSMLGYAEDELEEHLHTWEQLVDPDGLRRTQALLHECMDGKRNDFSVEFRMRHKQGHWVGVLSRAYVSRDENDAPVRIVGTYLDITGRNQARQQIEVERNRARQYLDIAGVMLIALDRDAHVTLINRKGCEILGLAEEQIIGRNWFADFLPAELGPQVRKVFDQLISGHDELAENYENPIVNAQGEQRHIAWHNSTIRDEQGKITGLLSSGEDVTEQRHTEERLKLMQYALDHVQEAAYLIDEQARFEYVNSGAMRHLGYTSDEMRRMRVFDISPDFPKEQWPAHWQELKEQGSITFETVHRRKDGSRFPVEIVPNYIDYQGNSYNLAFVRDISERKRIEESLRESSERYRAVRGTTRDGFFVTDLNGRLVEVNDAYCAFSGYSREELLIMSISQIAAKKSGSEVDEHIQRIIAQGNDLFETHVRHKDGGALPVEVSVSFSDTGGGKLFVFLRDIRQRKQEEQLFELHKCLSEIVYQGDLQQLMQTALDTAEGLTESEIGFFHFVEEDQQQISLQVWSTRTLREMCFAEGEGLHYPVSEAGVWVDCIHQRKPVIHNDYASLPHKKGLPQGHAELLRVLAVPVFREERIVAVAGVGNKQMDYTPNDVTLLSRVADMAYDLVERKRAEDQVEYMAYYDVLTGLSNRVLLLDRLTQSIAQARRSGKLLAVCYLDLDEFKPVNDRYGHHIGDALLIELAENLQEIMREGDTLARLGGDEFVILLNGLGSLFDCEEVIHRVFEVINKPLDIVGHRIHISGSIGITLYPTDNSSAEILLRHADQAMYQAKEAGKSSYRIFDPVQDQNMRNHREILNEFDLAIRDGQLALYFQPRIDLRNGELIGAEALIRWHHPDKGLLLPGDFLPSILETPKEIELGEWVVRNALDQHIVWHAQGLSIPVSVNISPRQMQLDGFAEYLGALLPQYPAGTAANLELEVLETFAIGDTTQVAKVMQRCADLGLRFSLDDFGTGYSSLTYFHRLPIDILKIDQNFVRQMLNEVSDLDIVEGVLRLAGALQRPVVAEGVESIEIGLMLLQMGCCYAQGYGIARPMPADQIAGWLNQWQQNNLWHQLHMERRDKGTEIELNVAIFSHRRWMAMLSEYLRDPLHMECPPLDENQCQFSRWYRGIGRARYGNRSSFAFIPPKHRDVHDDAKVLVALAQDGHLDKAIAGMGDFNVLSQEFIDLLERLGEE